MAIVFPEFNPIMTRTGRLMVHFIVVSLLLNRFLYACCLPAPPSTEEATAGIPASQRNRVTALQDKGAPSERFELAQQTMPADRAGAGISGPVPLHKVEPDYSEEAREARLEGTVVLSIIVDVDGNPRISKVIRRLGLGLDEKAIEAVEKWRFKPALKDGRAVAAMATVEVHFRILEDLNLLLKRARQGDVRAQFEIALMYQLGQGVRQDLGAAIRWYRIAADQGLAHAQSNLGNMYERGDGVAQDYGQALKWYRRAADQGLAQAESNLGNMYERGDGVAQDYGQALKWYREAAGQGLAAAQFNLGHMYYAGRGVQQDHGQAAAYYRMAAEQGLATAQYSLGLMLAHGQGAIQNRVEAYMWLELAESSQNAQVRKLASSAREQISKTMDREQVAEAQRLAREWKPKKP